MLKSLFVASPRLTLAVAESLTVGRVQALAAAESGASEFFLGGVTAYSLEQKVRLLGVEAEPARAVWCVSATVAEEMARGVCRLFGSDVGLATTGWAEPSPAAGVTVPFAWWALAWRTPSTEASFQTETGRVEVAGLGRQEVQAQVARLSIEALIRRMRRMRGERG